MPRLMLKTDDNSFNVDVPMVLIDSMYYIMKHDYEEAINKVLGETEKYKKAFEDTKVERDKQVSEMNAHINCLKDELEEIQMNKLKFPSEPIKVADMLIDNSYSTGCLRQIAEHLLVYCNNAEVE